MQVKALILALVYFLLARFGMLFFSLQPNNITLIWLPSGIAVAMFMAWGWRSVPWVILASFAANLPGMADGQMPVLHTLISALADASVGPIAAYFLQRNFPAGLTQAKDLLPFGIYSCLLPTALSGTLITLNLVAGGYIDASQINDFFCMLLMADSLGILLVYPVFQGWRDQHLIQSDTIEMPWLSGAAVTVAIVLSLSFKLHASLIYLIIPTLLLLAFNARMLGVALISGLSMLWIIIATAHNSGPFIMASSVDTNYRLMIFVCSTALTIFGISLQKRQLLLTEQSNLNWKNAAERDALSDLLNRRAFLPKLGVEHERSKRSNRPYTLAMLDLDRFKQINDNYGHFAGDKLICALAEVMKESTRAMDLIVRMGGEEFGILLPECSEAQSLEPLERIRNQFGNTILEVNGKQYSGTVSIGIASYQPSDTSWHAVMQRADAALYMAKEAGRNQILGTEALQAHSQMPLTPIATPTSSTIQA